MRLIAAVCITILSLTSLSALAQTIAVVDEKVFENSKVVQNIKKQIEAKRSEFQTEVEQQEKELLKEDEELAKQKDIISQDAFEKKAKDFRARFVETQKLLQMRRSQLEDANKVATDKVREKIKEIIADIAKDEDFKIAITKSRLLYNEDALDISQAVLKRLNNEMPSIKLDIKD